MNIIWKQIIQSLALGAVLPGMVCSVALRFDIRSMAVEEPPTVAEKTPAREQSVQPRTVTIPVLNSGKVDPMELEEYIGRVVLGEVPASFDEEALKAQAVAARTYTLRCIQAGDKHPDGAVCTDYRCCQAYREPEEYLESGGSQESVDKIFRAVTETAGEVLYYDGELICATYFASSGGVTEDAREVWGEAYPYLKTVSSPGEEDCGYYSQTVTFTADEFQEILGVRLDGSPACWFGMTAYTAGGGVDLMRIGAKLYTGVELRGKLGLRSTIFTVTTGEDAVTFETRGYGHRVGMSQYGADAMAATGSSYRDILAHYYTGTTLSQYIIDGN